MKNAVWIILVILIILGAVGYIFIETRLSFFSRNSSLVASSTASQNTVTYLCTGGSNITATYASSSVALVLSDGRYFTLPQVISGSGIRYEEGASTTNDIIFWSEGENAFLMENNQPTYNNCVGGTISTSTQSGGMSVFTDQGETFSFQYPSTFPPSDGGIGYTQGWMYNSTTTGLILATVTIPKSFEPNTNFAGAEFTVGTSPDPKAVSSCLSLQNPNGITPTQVTINGITYTAFSYTSAGVGNFYAVTSYRTIHNNQCYAIESLIHSTDINNYPPGQVSQFNGGEIQTLLQQIMQSFKFLS